MLIETDCESTAAIVQKVVLHSSTADEPVFGIRVLQCRHPRVLRDPAGKSAKTHGIRPVDDHDDHDHDHQQDLRIRQPTTIINQQIKWLTDIIGNLSTTITN